jgi:hypothetical protein
MEQTAALNHASGWLLQHGYSLLVGGVLIETLGAPIPAAPLLLAIGALASAGKFSFLLSITLAASARRGPGLVPPGTDPRRIDPWVPLPPLPRTRHLRPADPSDL